MIDNLQNVIAALRGTGTDVVQPPPTADRNILTPKGLQGTKTLEGDSIATDGLPISYQTPAPEMSAADQAAMMPETYANPLVKKKIENLVRVMSIPGQALASKEPITTEQMIQPAHDMAMSFGALGLPMAEQNSLGMAGGRIPTRNPEELAAYRRDMDKKKDLRDVQQRQVIKDDLAKNPIEDTLRPRSPTNYIDELVGKYNSGNISVTEGWILKRLLNDRYR